VVVGIAAGAVGARDAAVRTAARLADARRADADVTRGALRVRRAPAGADVGQTHGRAAGALVRARRGALRARAGERARRLLADRMGRLAARRRIPAEVVLARDAHVIEADGLRPAAVIVGVALDARVRVRVAD